MNTASLYGPVRAAASSVLGEHCLLGYPKEARLRAEQDEPGSAAPGAPVTLGERCLVFNHVVVYEGAQLGHGCVVEDRVRVGYDTSVGANARLLYGAYICDRVSIGRDARVAGFVCDGSTIGDRATVMGQLVHEYTRPHEGWWQVDEPSPVIEADTVIGYGAVVVGGVRIGPRSYVAAGAVVTKDVGPDRVVTAVNVQTPAARWSGARLQALIRHWSETG